MSLFCNRSCNNLSCCNNCVAAATTTTPCSNQECIVTTLKTVIDGCSTCEPFTTEILIPVDGPLDVCDLEVGDLLNVKLCGDITCQEVQREHRSCYALSTILYNFPIKIFTGNGHCHHKDQICQNIPFLNAVNLKCSTDSTLECDNNTLLSIIAIVTAIDCHHITVSIQIVAKLVTQQVAIRDYEILASPRGAIAACATDLCAILEADVC